MLVKIFNSLPALTFDFTNSLTVPRAIHQAGEMKSIEAALVSDVQVQVRSSHQCLHYVILLCVYRHVQWRFMELILHKANAALSSSLSLGETIPNTMYTDEKCKFILAKLQ